MTITRNNEEGTYFWRHENLKDDYRTWPRAEHCSARAFARFPT